MSYRLLRRRSHLTDILARSQVEYGKYDKIQTLIERVIHYVRPSDAIAKTSPQWYGLNSEQLANWCRELGISPSGNAEQRVKRIIAHFDNLRPQIREEVDHRARWYDFFDDLASRDYNVLRAQHVIEKDLEIESKFEDATKYLFADRLNHAPLQQRGTNHPDGLLSLQDRYLMWDNKSKESPVTLKDHIDQFDSYMNQADKPVPVFLVIAPEFTDESETLAIQYHAKHFERNIALITATELKSLAEEWSSEKNKKREEPFPIGSPSRDRTVQSQTIGKIT